MKNEKVHPIKNCVSCHNIEESDKSVAIYSGYNCHKNVITDFKVYELHMIHTKAKYIKCFDCHNRIIHRK